MHQREAIRSAVISRLSGNTAAGTRVSDTPVDPYPNRPGELPAISVYTPSDEIDSDFTTPRELWRKLDLEIVAWVVHSDSSSAAHQMDDLASSIEGIMDTDLFLGGACGGDGLVLSSTETAVIKDLDGRRIERPLGLLKMTYTIPYSSDRSTVTPPNALNTVDAKTQITGAASNNIAENNISLE